MTHSPALIPTRRILFAFGEHAIGPRWLGDMDARLVRSGMVLCPAHSGQETIRRVEEGGLCAAVVFEDQRAIDGLSLVRIIRSIDQVLPCWLLTGDTRRTTLETALALHVTSVLTSSIGPGELAATLCRRLLGSDGVLD